MASKNKTTIMTEPGKQELFITREFDAPRELVFKAYTDPDIYVRWLGPRDLDTSLEMFEPVSGGRWRFVQKDKDGNDLKDSNGNIIYEEIVDLSKLEDIKSIVNELKTKGTKVDTTGMPNKENFEDIKKGLEEVKNQNGNSDSPS